MISTINRLESKSDEERLLEEIYTITNNHLVKDDISAQISSYSIRKTPLALITGEVGKPVKEVFSELADKVLDFVGKHKVETNKDILFVAGEVTKASKLSEEFAIAKAFKAAVATMSVRAMVTSEEDKAYVLKQWGSNQELLNKLVA